jgi:hypothetical protein
MRGGWVQTRLQRQLLEADRVGVVGKDIEQLHHALDDLDAAARFRRGIRGLVHHGNLLRKGNSDTIANRATAARAPI